MAGMIPNRVSANTQSSAERRLFLRIKEEASDEWTVLHSVGLGNHPRKLWAEIDFVLIGPPGVICLEVKGGRVRRQNGMWQFIDGAGHINEKHEGPFEQVGSASAALFTWLRAKVPAIRQAFVGYAVTTPDSPWEVTGPDIVNEVLHDSNSDETMQQYLTRVSDYWRATANERLGAATTLLDEKSRAAIAEALRGDFDLRPSIRARVRQINDDLLSLTAEQYRVLDGLVDNPRALIRGGAGTGKTVLALEEASRAATAGARVAVVCSSRRLGRYLEKAIGDTCGPVGHLHGIMADLVRRAGRHDRLPDVSSADLFAVFYPEQALESLADLGELGGFDVLIVDEAQDLLRDAYLDVFDGLLDGGLAHGSWRMFLDPIQDLFDVAHAPALQRVTGHGAVQYRLTVNCRNSQEIATHTALLSDTPLSPVLQVEGVDIEQHWYRDRNDQRRQVSRHIDRLLSGGIAPEDIVVLGRKRLEWSSFAEGLIDVPYPLVDLGDDERVDGAIGYSTIAGFKGLEADAVVVVDVEALGTPESGSDLYVGTSRARALLAVFAHEDAKESYGELAGRFGERLAGLNVSRSTDLRTGGA